MFAFEFTVEFALLYSNCITTGIVQIFFYGNNSPMVMTRYGDDRTIISKCK